MTAVHPALTDLQNAEIVRIEDRHGPLVLVRGDRDRVTVGIQSHATAAGDRQVLRWLDLDRSGRVVANVEVERPDFGSGDHGLLRSAAA